jgi:hypothetical protein
MTADRLPYTPNASLNARKPGACLPTSMFHSITAVLHKLVEQQIHLLLHAQHI